MYYVIAALLGSLTLIVIVAAMRPTDFKIVRSQLIVATPQELFPFINNLKKFQQWNPFKDKDPAARNDFSGPEEGEGAVFRWAGNANAGEGIMTIVKSIPDTKVKVDLEFVKPFAGHNTVEFTLVPETSGTLVTRSMVGKYALVPKIVGLFMNMNQMIGNDFEKGLSRFKLLTESRTN